MPQVKRIYSATARSVDDLALEMPAIKSRIKPGAIVLLSGDLAAGKTTWVSYFCREWGVRVVQSPTYAIHQRYQNESVKIDHFDLYRLETEEQLESSGFFDLLSDPADYKLIEWPERIDLADLPAGRPVYLLNMRRLPDEAREMDLSEVRY